MPALAGTPGSVLITDQTPRDRLRDGVPAPNRDRVVYGIALDTHYTHSRRRLKTHPLPLPLRSV